MKRHDSINGVLLLEAHEASELLDRGSYYYERDGEVASMQTFAGGPTELHGTELVLLGFLSSCIGYAAVTKGLYRELTGEAIND